MPIESAVYIGSLNPVNPAGSDPVADSDNHIRLIKQALKNTFPNVNGPVNVDQYALSGGVPIGGIIIWSGSIATIPAGWVLCAGSTFSRTDGGGNIVAPNLEDRFVVGAGGTLAVGATGGSIVPTGTAAAAGSHSHAGSYTGSAGGHNHGGSSSSTSLSVDQLPAHQHSIPVKYYGAAASGTGFTTFGSQGVGDSTLITDTVGSGNPHTHAISTDGAHTHTLAITADGSHTHTISITDGRPPFYALAYIMKI